ncbi:MAG: ubiquitin-like protein Pup [Candidatus Nomurabacteria bacterium]|nr:MAG: ubiquitin-like protein Pup [Candidatus Nomurabacteria bacterium]
MAGEKGGQVSGRENRSDDDESTTRDLGRAATADNQAEWSSETVDDIDSMLDEMDDVLEENAEEFVNAYKQKGGQ